jgi:biotin transport system substrate-specific component
MATASPQTSTPRSAATVRTARSAGADIAAIAGFAALLAVLAQIAIPTGTPVPITLQTLGVVLAGAVLGPWRGFLSVTLYLVVGLAGLPVFAEATGGVAVLTKASAGYLLSFPFAAAAIGALVLLGARRGWHTRAWWIFTAATLVTVTVIYIPGILVLGWRVGVDLPTALGYGAVYLPGDLLKNAVAAMVVAEVHRAFPSLLSRRRAASTTVPAAEQA